MLRDGIFTQKKNGEKNMKNNEKSDMNERNSEIGENMDSYNLKVVEGEILLHVQNEDESTPKVRWSGNLSPYSYDPEEDEFPEGWGLTQLEDGRIVETIIFAARATALIISKETAIREILAFRKYELLEMFDLSNELYEIVRGLVK